MAQVYTETTVLVATSNTRVGRWNPIFSRLSDQFYWWRLTIDLVIFTGCMIVCIDAMFDGAEVRLLVAALVGQCAYFAMIVVVLYRARRNSDTPRPCDKRLLVLSLLLPAAQVILYFVGLATDPKDYDWAEIVTAIIAPFLDMMTMGM